MTPHPDRHHGIALLLALAAITVAGVTLSAAARRAIATGIEADRACADLRERWACSTCARAVLRIAGPILADAGESPDGPAAATRRLVADLNGQPHTIVVSDEQAKANVNLLAEGAEPYALAETLRSLYVQGEPPGIAPAASHPGPDLPEGWPAFGSYGQIFDETARAQLLRDPAFAAAEPITCWGSGRLHFRRAHPAALAVIADRVLTALELRRLIEYREQRTDATAEQAVASLTLPADRAEQLAALLTDTSRCHSVCVVGPRRTAPAAVTHVRIDPEPTGGDEPPPAPILLEVEY